MTTTHEDSTVTSTDAATVDVAYKTALAMIAARLAALVAEIEAPLTVIRPAVSRMCDRAFATKLVVSPESEAFNVAYDKGETLEFLAEKFRNAQRRCEKWGR